MEHQQANPCSRLGTAAGISPVSPLPGGKKRGKKPLQFPQQQRKALDLVWKMLLFFLLSNISSSQSLLCSYMEIGAGRLGCSSKWH